jgi:hypothetical protein
VEPGLVVDTGIRQISGTAEKVSIASHVLAGTEAFVKVTESVAGIESPGSLMLAEALAQLGDWYLAINRIPNARETYQMAYQVLAGSAPSRQAADAYFGDPIPLRFMRNELSPLNAEPPEESADELRVSMNVSRHGNAKNVKILNPPENMEEPQVRRIARMLSELQYRPRLSNGMPEKADDFVWNYQLRVNDLLP